MYLTQFRFNTARVGARRLLSSPHRLHGAVTASFTEPTRPTDGGPRTLWRVDETAQGDVLLYLTGPDRPDLTHLVEQAGWPTTQKWRTFEYAPFLDRITTGDAWNFRLTANPVHSIRRKDGEETKRTAHLTAPYQKQWLLKHQERAGFTIEEKPQERRRLPTGDEYQLVVHSQRNLNFGKPGLKKPVTITAVTFDGRLRVTDADALRHTLTAGLGKSKAYGCGLMTLAAPE